jgi:ABC-type transport system involved in cytochrome bd biosynthesis fused ATPase/permease subunit
VRVLDPRLLQAAGPARAALGALRRTRLWDWVRELPDGLDTQIGEALMHDLLTAAPGRSILLVTHRPEGLELVDDVVDLSRCCS